MSDIDLGTARGTIEIDSSGLSSATTAARQLGLGLIGMGTAAVGGFLTAVKAAADFEQKLDHLGAVTGASEADLERVRQKALEIGRSTVFGADEAISAFVELGKAGLNLEDIMGGVADAAVNLAAAGDIGLTRATEILVNTMRTFQLGAGDAARIADLLAGAANASTVEVEDLAVSLKYAGSIADAAGISLEDVATALAIMGNAGIKGSTAGTSLRKILLDLSPASKKARDQLEDLGIITEDGANKFFDANGKAKGLAEIFQILHDATKGLTEEQRNLALDIIFGNRAIASAVVLSRGGAEAFNAMKAQINEVTAADVAAKRLDNLNGSIRRLVNTIKTKLIESGGQVQNTLKAIVDKITELIVGFDNLSPHTQGFILWTLLVGGSLLILLGTFALFISYILWMVRAFLGFREAILILRELGLVSRLLSPLTFVLRQLGLAILFVGRSLVGLVVANPIVAAILAVIVTLTILYFKVQAVRDIIDTIGRAFKTAFEAIIRAASAVVDFFSNNWQTILTLLLPFIALPLLIIQNWSSIVGFFASVLSSIVGFFTALPGQVAGAVSSFVTTVLGAFLNLAAQIPYLLGYIIGFAIGFFIRLHVEAIQFGVRFVEIIWGFLSQIPGLFIAMVTLVATTVANWVVSMVSSAIELGTSFIQTIVSFFSQLPGIIGDFFTQTLPVLAGWVVNMVGGAIDAGSQFLGSIVSFFSQLPGMIGEFLGNAIQAVWTWANTLWSAGLDAGQRFFSAVWEGIQGLPGMVEGLLERVIQAFLNLINRAYNAAKNFAKGLWDGFKNALFGSPHTKIEYAVWDMVDNVQASIGTLRNQLGQLASMGSKFAMGQLGQLGLPPVTMTAAGISGAGAIANSTGDVFNNQFKTEADAEQIAFEIMWQKRTRIR